MKKAQFEIYVTSSASGVQNSFRVFKEVCEEILGKKNVEIVFVDIIKHAQQAGENRIIATPTIIRKYPAPERRIIGEIRDRINAGKAVEYLLNDL